MGEMADEMINRYLDNPGPHGLDDEPAVTCKVCHKECVWEQTPAGWRLFDLNGELHDCNDPFELVKQLENQNARMATSRNHPERSSTKLNTTKSVSKKRGLPRHRSD